MSSANSPTASTPCSHASKHTSPNSGDSQPTPPTNCAPHWRSRRHFSRWSANDPNRDTGELVERLHAVNARAIRLTEALLLLNRTDQRSFTREQVDLSLIVEEAIETLLPLAEKHGVTIETSGDITPTIGSHALLLQMTTNLLHNAIVHNLPEHGTVQVYTAIRPESVMLTVENTGEKLTPQLVSTLTEPFQRGTQRIRTDHAGVGLGLAIVKSITQAHDGTLTIVPRPDGGICVTAQLPAGISYSNGVSGAVG
jgi:two-component system, OmpR family, sensor histidine kinase VanS